MNCEWQVLIGVTAIGCVMVLGAYISVLYGSIEDLTTAINGQGVKVRKLKARINTLEKFALRKRKRK